MVVRPVAILLLACAVSLLAACGGGGGGGGVVPQPGPKQPSTDVPITQQPSTDVPITPALLTAYLSDAAVEGVEYSGPAGNGVTGEGGMFTASEGTIRFSIGGTTLGSVQINEDWENAHLTPADFVGVDMAGVISITRILQGLDEDGNPQNGISISQTARSGAQNLFDDLTESGTIAVTISGKTYNIPSADKAMQHFVSTRQCIFSGVYAGGYKATIGPGARDERPGYFAFEPFANRARGEFSAANDLMSVVITVGGTRSVVTLSAGNELDFVTPRLVTGVWSSATESGTNRFTLLAGDPRATLRIVGIEIDGGQTVGLYALDYFDSDGSFRGQYYDVKTNNISVLLYEGGGAWPDAMMTANLTLTRGNDAITLEVARKDDNYGEFEGIGDYEGLSGTWCDLRGSGPIAPITPIMPVAAAQSDSEISITWSEVAGATHYKLYRSSTSGGSYTQIGGEITATGYVDSGLTANTSYYYQLEACNDNGCSGRSLAGSVTTDLATPSALMAVAQSDSAISITWSAIAGATRYELYRSETSGGSLTLIGSNITATGYVDSGFSANTPYYYQLKACNGNRCSGRSSVVSATTAPEPPSALTAATQSDSAISITWSAVAEAMHYKLYRSATRGGSFAQIRGNITATVYVDRGLVADTSYYYQLESCNGNGCSGRSPTVSATTAPEPPSTATATAQSDSAISITWSAVAGAAHYKLYRATTNGGLFDQIGENIAATVTVDSGLDANTSYKYQLESCNDNGCSGRSSAVSATTALAQPPAPTATAQSDSAISIAWSAVVDAMHYKLYRATMSGGPFAQIGGDITGTDHVDTKDLAANTSYYYQLAACNGNGCSDRSLEVSATTAPEPPSALTAATQSDSAISIAWSAVVDAAHYKLYRATVSGGLFDQIGENIAATVTVDSGLDANTSYKYQLESCNDNGCSGRSSAVSATTALAQPPAPTATAQSDSAISIAWSAVVDAAHYKLYRATVSGGPFAQIGGDITGTDHVDTKDLAANTSYYYQLAACNGNGCSDRSLEVSATTAPEPPSALTATAQSDSAISIAWSAVADATHYKLYRATTSEGSFAQIGGSITVTDYVDTKDLAANTSYDYQLESCNDNGCSGRSPTVSATTAPEPPSALMAATQSDSAISITWSAVAGAAHYKLYRATTSEGLFARIGDDIIATDYVDDNGLAANTSYDYQLESCNDNGCSSRSRAVSATTALAQPPAPTATAQSDSAISITWSAVVDAMHYKLYRAKTSGGPFAQIGGDITGTDYVDASDLAANTSYYYQLAACNGNGCSDRSLEVSATTAPEPPSALTAITQSDSAIPSHGARLWMRRITNCIGRRRARDRSRRLRAASP